MNSDDRSITMIECDSVRTELGNFDPDDPDKGRLYGRPRSRGVSAVCRRSALVFAFLFCVHLLVVFTVDVGPMVDRIALQQASLVLPGAGARARAGAGAGVGADAGTKHRSKRGAGGGGEGPDDGRDPLDGREEEGKGFLPEHLNKSSDDERGVTVSSVSLCRFGHIQGFNAVCEAQPCLRLLKGGAAGTGIPPPTQSRSPGEDTSQVLRRISRISGHLDPVHFSIVPFVARFQWANDLYGSVGEFGVSTGKFTTLLSTYTDVDAGERLFAVDPFNRTGAAGDERRIAGLSPLQVFATHMRDFGFEEESAAESSSKRRLYLYRGSSKTLDKRVFASWDLPQFRMISVDADLDRTTLISDLETAACLIRDGGVIVVNGIDDPDSRQMTVATLAGFFAKRGGRSTLTPIVSAGNKLYVTTTNWGRKYVDALSSDVILQHSGLIQSAVIMGPFSTELLALTANEN